jgi:hypothetical protein
MANEKAGAWERFGNFWERTHIALGILAVAGALVVPPAAPILTEAAAYEAAHVVVWDRVKEIGKKPEK